MSLCHHLIVHVAAKRINVEPQYVLLGDDIVITGHELASSYRSIVESLGMEINMQKTLVSNDSFEFVKRFHSKGSDLSPLPLGSIRHAGTQYWLWADFIKQAEQRGYTYHWNKSVLPKLFQNFGVPKRKARYLEIQVNKFYYTVDPYSDDLINDFQYKIQKQLGKQYPFSCNIREDYCFTYIFELLINTQMEEIHENVVRSVKNFNRIARNTFFTSYKEKFNKYHPIVSILHKCAQSLQQVEYSVSQDPIAETSSYVKSKLTLKDFSFIPSNIETVVSVKGHVKTLVTRVNTNRRLKDVLNRIDVLRDSELRGEDH